MAVAGCGEEEEEEEEKRVPRVVCVKKVCLAPSLSRFLYALPCRSSVCWFWHSIPVGRL